MESGRYMNSVNLRSGTEFPYLVLIAEGGGSRPRNPGFRVMHWHEDLQFVLALDGTAEVKTLGGQLRLVAGEGLFLNRNVVHRIRALPGYRAVNFLFPARFLGFYAGSPAARFVTDVTEDEGFPLLRFTPDVGWHREILASLRALARLETRKTELYPYEVLVRLSALWLLLRRHLSAPRKEESPAGRRVRAVLRYVAAHYGEDVSLADLAASAGVSKTECARCFRLCLGTSPWAYLTEYRLAEAARLLRETDEPVGAIALRTGFGESSHFGRRFREKTGLSPRAYRKQYRRS